MTDLPLACTLDRIHREEARAMFFKTRRAQREGLRVSLGDTLDGGREQREGLRWALLRQLSLRRDPGYFGPRTNARWKSPRLRRSEVAFVLGRRRR